MIADKTVRMSIVIAVGWGIALVLCAASFWIRRQRRSRNPFNTRSGAVVNPPKMTAMANAGDALVYVNEGGSVRELTETEKKYVDTEFSPFDGARPYIKSRYLDRTARGIQGFLPRVQVPADMSIHSAPPQNTLPSQTPQAVADSLVELVRKHGRG